MMTSTLLTVFNRSVLGLAVATMLSGCVLLVPAHKSKAPDKHYKTEKHHPVYDQHPGKGHKKNKP